MHPNWCKNISVCDGIVLQMKLSIVSFKHMIPFEEGVEQRADTVLVALGGGSYPTASDTFAKLRPTLVSSFGEASCSPRFCLSKQLVSQLGCHSSQLENPYGASSW